MSLSTVDDSLYFMCNTEDFKFLAEMIQHVPLPLRARYIFCCAPINRKMPFVCSMFLKVSNFDDICEVLFNNFMFNFSMHDNIVEMKQLPSTGCVHK